MRALVELFGRSPFGPLAEHTARVHECVECVRPLFEAFLAGDDASLEAIYQKISKVEHKADILKNEIRDHLPRSIFLPVDRGDILKFLKEQDAIADAVEDIAVLLTLRRTTVIEELKPEIMAFVDKAIETSELLMQVAGELKELAEVSFGGPEVEKVLEMIGLVSHKEWEADNLQQAVAKRILHHEGRLDPISILFWMNILKAVGEVANHAESTGDVLRMMVSRG